MKILVACEESQAVTIELRRLGHEAYSCDLEPCSGGHPEWHIQADVLPLLNGRCKFETMDGVEHKVDGRWDMLFAFPPCTYLSSAQAGWYNVKKYGEKAIIRAENRGRAVTFFMRFVNADCEKICIENPVGFMSSRYRKPDQIIQPWQFGDEAQKTTCLWFKNLSPLKNGRVVSKGAFIENKRKDGRTEMRPAWFKQGEAWSMTEIERHKARSKTFHGIAVAMAEQWAGQIKGDL